MISDKVFDAARSITNSEGQLITGLHDFWLWFDDSVAVDSDGRPLLVYRGEHGSSHDISTRLGSFSFGSKEIADQYANRPNNRENIPLNPKVFSGYLKITNPLINSIDDPFIDLSLIWDIFGMDVAIKIATEQFETIKELDIWQEEFISEYDSIDQLLEKDPIRIKDLYVYAFRLFDEEWFVKLASDQGFDGAIHAEYGFHTESKNHAEYKVFNVDQFVNDNIIGNGNSGLVIKIGNEVEKNSTNDEAKIYVTLKGTEGIAKGYELNGKIRLPFYAQVISVDTIALDDRKGLSDVVGRNINRINSAISALTNIGYDYNDPLQFGVNTDGSMDLIDFSISTNKYPKEVLHNNLSTLSRFYREFGCEVVSKAISQVNEVITNQHSRIKSPFIYDFFEDEFDGVHYRKLEDALDGQCANFAYYSYGHVDIDDVAQTDGEINIILSLRELTEDEMLKWNIVNVYSSEEEITFSPLL